MTRRGELAGALGLYVVWVGATDLLEGRPRTFLRPAGAVLASGAVLLVPMALFGLYRYAHSPPFNSLEMVLFLSGIGLLTGGFFLASGDGYGSAAFHNFLGTLGVLRALEEAGRLETFARPRWPVLATVALAVGALVGLHRIWLPPPSGNRPGKAGERDGAS